MEQAARVEMDPVVASAPITSFGAFIDAYVHLERQIGGTLEARTGLPHVWFEVLVRLARAPQHQISMGVLASQVLLSSGGVTRMVDRMRSLGLVERVRSDEDLRVYYARLTDDGMRTINAAAAVQAEIIAEHFTSRLEPEELATVLDILQRFRHGAVVNA